MLGSNDKTNEQACCNCGGSIHQTVVPSAAPSNIPSSSPTICTDEAGWVADTGYPPLTCNDYTSLTCQTLPRNSTSGTSNEVACCDCGGGSRGSS